MSWRIELLDKGNSSLLENLDDDVFDEAIDPAQLAAFVADPRHILAMAIINEEVVGMASGVECFHPDKQPQLFINEVGVSGAHQRQGIGRALVQRLLEEAKRRGCESAWLGTEDDNIAARACYNAVPGGKEPESFVLYEWELPDGSFD